MTEPYERDSSDLIALTSEDQEEILSKLSDDILIDNIIEQISSRMIMDMLPNDILKSYNRRYNYIIGIYQDYDEIIEQSKALRDNLYTDIYKRISEKFNFNSNIDDIMGTPDYYSYIEGLYDFFILSYKDNLTKTVVADILANHKDYSNQVSDMTNKDDLVYKSISKSIPNDDHVHILYNLNDIVDIITNTYMETPLGLLKAIVEVDEYKTSSSIVSDIFLEDTQVNGDVDLTFASTLASPLRISPYRGSIINDVRGELSMIFKKDKGEVV